MRIFLILLLETLALCQTASVSSGSKSLEFQLRQRSTITFSISNAEAQGGQASLDISIATSRLSPAGLQFDLTWPAGDITAATAAPGPQATAAGKSVQCASITNGIRCLVLGGTSTIQNGVAAVATFTVARATVVTLSNTLATNETGRGPGYFTVIAPGGGVITVPIEIAALSCPSLEIEPDQELNCTVTISAPAPAGGLDVTFQVSDATKLALAVNPVRIAAGATSATWVLIGK